MSSLDRKDYLSEAGSRTFDLLVIGGGATGAGIALDAASRGLETLLVEKQDFAGGTSSRSTKLIHGGLRYLKQLEIALVREVGRERAIVHNLAPHLVVPEKMLLPLIKGGTYGKLATSAGLMVYDVLAGVEGEDQRVMLSKEETLEKEPLLEAEMLEGGGYYAEYRTDDARLTIEVLKTASSFGAVCLNYTEVISFVYSQEGNITGAVCQDVLTGKSINIKAKQIVSAAGPWVDELRDKDKSLTQKRLHLTKGVHIVLPWEKLPVRQSIYFDVPDGRMIFAIPRGKITYVGTTDTDYQGNKENPRTLVEDVEYLLKGVNHMFPEIELKVADVESSWAGLRPLIHEEGKSASELSRKDEIFESKTGLISIAGGKLTGYRKMAERTVDLVVKRIKKGSQKTRTQHLVLSGGEFGDVDAVFQFSTSLSEKLEAAGILEPKSTAKYLVENYGRQSLEIVLLANRQQEEEAEVKLILAELAFVLKYEMVNAALDFFSRRSGRLYFNLPSVREYGDLVIEHLAHTLDWNSERILREKEELQLAIHEASHFPVSV
ncbi:MAG: glycerol-3-phosphate dehydrogenase/oxidase [Bacteroidota bacterium]